MSYPLVDLIDLNFPLDGIFGELFIFLDIVFFFLELLSQHLDSVVHGLHLFPLSFDFVLFVCEGKLGVYLQRAAH